MRLKESRDSWKASNIIRKVSEVPATVRKIPGRKNTAKWCKGKVGVFHDPQLTKISTWHFGWHETETKLVYWRCSRCRKEWIQSLER